MKVGAEKSFGGKRRFTGRLSAVPQGNKGPGQIKEIRGGNSAQFSPAFQEGPAAGPRRVGTGGGKGPAA